ncbi:MAG: adenylosuccinate lyase [Anaerolineales bacterium]|nr:adenylosuccinate lyase [Anaerolineales bacterium]
MSDFEVYASPFSWRYGSVAMRRVWSEENKRLVWRQLWVALAEVQAEFGLVSAAGLADIQAHAQDVDIAVALALEAELHHDLMAELRVFAGQCAVGGGMLHLGATSMDIKDNADVLLIRQSLQLVLPKLEKLLQVLCQLIERWADTPLIAFTHLQPAEPSTLGYRLAQYAQDLFSDWEALVRLRESLRAKGIRGAVGTGASFIELIGAENLAQFEAQLSACLGVPFYPVVTQTYPRKQDYDVVGALAGLGASIYKFAFDLRVLQSPPIGELGEPFREKQVGSSAMPFKRNPVISEKIDSLGRYLAQLPRIAWDNAAHSLLERTLDDSANRRTMLPEAFLVVDELLEATTRICSGLRVDEGALARNLEIYGAFAATERVLMALAKAGADRQVMHEHLRAHSMRAWNATQAGQDNPLVALICADEVFKEYVGEASLRELMDAGEYVGDAPARARALSQNIRAMLPA